MFHMKHRRLVNVTVEKLGIYGDGYRVTTGDGVVYGVEHSYDSWTTWDSAGNVYSCWSWQHRALKRVIRESFEAERQAQRAKRLRWEKT